MFFLLALGLVWVSEALVFDRIFVITFENKVWTQQYLIIRVIIKWQQILFGLTWPRVACFSPTSTPKHILLNPTTGHKVRLVIHSDSTRSRWGLVCCHERQRTFIPNEFGRLNGEQGNLLVSTFEPLHLISEGKPIKKIILVIVFLEPRTSFT
jgi:hypothetical protein